MRRRHSLRARVAFAFALFGAAVSLTLSAWLHYAAHDVGQRLIDETLKAELDDYVARRMRNPNSLPPATASIQGYVRKGIDEQPAIPDAVRILAPGTHEFTLDDKPFRAIVADAGPERIFILFNETRQRAREQRFLAYLALGIALMTMLSAGGGLWLARRVIAPVTDLAALVRAAEPGVPPLLATDQPRDEIGDLARVFDLHLQRLHGFIDREHAFTADVSHELRTPVAIIQGAVEVISEEGTLTPSQKERFARIERATRDMADLIRALLLLAREPLPGRADAPSCDVAEILRENIEKHRYMLRGKRTEVRLDIRAEPRIAAEGVLISVVIANLLRNAYSYTDAGRVLVELEAGSLRISDTGQGIGGEEIGHVFRRHYRGATSKGAGIGLSLVKRICDRYGWSIVLESSEGAGTTAVLSFGPKAV